MARITRGTAKAMSNRETNFQREQGCKTRFLQPLFSVTGGTVSHTSIPWRVTSELWKSEAQSYQILQSICTRWLATQLEPIPLSSHPNFTPDTDVSIIIPLVGLPSATFLEAIETWITNSPLEIIVVTPESNYHSLQSAVKHIPHQNTHLAITTVPKASKRQQLSRGITKARGSILVLADSDVLWQPTLLVHLLAAFEDPTIGGVGPFTKIVRKHNSIPEFIMHRRFVQRYRHIAATFIVDGHLICLSGRTAAYRAQILKDETFLREFTNDYWKGNLLDSGDDAFITRWIQERGWRAVLQVASQAEVFTWASDGWRIVGQWIRWTRNSKRSFWRYLSCWDVFSRQSYFALNMVESLLRPFLSIWFVMGFCSRTLSEKTRFRICSIWICFGLLQCLADFEDWPLSVSGIAISLLMDIYIVVFDVWGILSLSNTAR
ncbi:uncharacterized protein LY89DRAFT_723372 [Mollisia scopiformis]|uniref:Uncharacterized protein n=1 Tax=Mollisia scopiformis TaxID=149040 RepID=A0A194WS53_MOLSC|nr:uncharacterized protein LY89DRAFT_723372 [Mollisia scopiformis]KUJ10803.1 hypothetical protein LY89DRAFT_723372 [Mollisia scopiformis]